MKKIPFTLALLALVFGAMPLTLDAQYFGRNKPRYESFDFKVLQTPHFEIYHYLDNSQLVTALANQAEHWYLLHQATLQDTFKQKNPLIFYNDHADFQQTNAVFGEISIGTGGVTEGLKNRVVLPIAMSNAQTKHVLGHELVHAFQYHMILAGDSTSMQHLANLPLWMIEGLAEYMSIGRVDANTSLWMRDAVLNDKVPRLKDLYNPQFFPYRWGQAFWAFVAGLKGDGVITPLFVTTAKYGFDEACRQVLGMKEEELSKLWVSAIKDHYGQFLGDKKERFVGRPFISKDKKGGRLNIGPVLSPNGKYVLFLSEKDLFSIDFYLADANTGDVIRKVHSSTRNGHLDDINFIESAGTWSSDSKQVAFVGVRKGQNVLVLKNLKGKTLETFEVPGVPAFSNPAWSPDGKSIVVAGLADGQVDLFQVFLKNKNVVRLTNDHYSEMHPAWAPNGNTLAFATDQLSFERNAERWTFNIAFMDMGDGEGKQVKIPEVFFGADNLNPVFDASGNVLFLSDRDGFRNLYQFEPASGKVFQMTELLTGISGITPYAPALTASIKENRDRVFFTHYFKGGHNIYKAKTEDFLHREVAPDSVNFDAATLLRVNKRAPDLVEANLSKLNELPELPASELKPIAFKPKFKLDYVGGGGVGVGVGGGPYYNGTTTGLSGNVDLLFGDILGDQMIFTSIFMNGEIFDAGAQVAYINQKKRLGWGVSLSHLPYSSGRFGYAGLDTLPIDDSPNAVFDHFIFDRIRTFEEKIGVFAQYPFSRTLRVEGGASLALYSNRVDRYDQYYDAFGRLIYQDRNKVDAEKVGLRLFNGNLATANLALVGDNSYFGLASPVKGYRYRLGVERYFGDFNFYNLTADYRRYVYVKPFTLAARLMHFGRYGKDGNSFYNIFLGYPWFMRGFEVNASNEILLKNGRSIDELYGSKIGLANFEIRMPFTGPENFALIKSKFFFTELSFFTDGGLAWDVFKKPADNPQLREFEFNPLFSAGVSLRINLFGALILEPYYAWPLLKDTQGVFGLNIVPGW
jgi:Tol biopolymer transport system component